jgi:sodium/proline symporter
MQIQMMASFGIYLSLLFSIGLIAFFRSSRTHRKGEPTSFILGGRSINYWVTALSAHASDMSSWLLMAFPAVVYANGVVELWIAISLVIGMFLTWHFVAPKLRQETEKYHAVTLSSYFEKRFNDTSGLLRLISALISAFFFTIYIATGAKAIGYILQSSFGIDYYAGTIVGISVVVLYTFIGGFVAVAWTDCFQALFLLGAALITPLVAFGHVGGIESIISAASAKGATFSLIPDFSLSSILSILFNPIAWGLGYFGMPHILNKFMGAQNANEMYKSKYIGIAWQIVAMGAAASVGLIGMAYFGNSLAGNSELIFVEMAKSLFSPFFAGFVICAILAAVISTMDSQMLVVAGVVAEDFYRNCIRTHAGEKEVQFVYRIAIVLVAFVAVFIAFDEGSSIHSLVKYAWSGFGCSFGPLVLMSLHSKSVNKYGAISGMVVGGATAALWKSFDAAFLHTGYWEMIPGFALGLLTIYFVSLLTNKKMATA